MKNIFAVIVVFLFFLSFSANATLIDLISIDELAEKSGLVVMGTPIEKHSYYNTDSTQIYTDVLIKITSKVRSECKDKITIVLRGGRVGQMTTYVLGAPQFTIGKEVLLCLKKFKDTNKYKIIGFNQGKFDIKAGKAFRDFKNTTFILKPKLESELGKAYNGIELNELLNFFKSPK